MATKPINGGPKRDDGYIKQLVLEAVDTALQAHIGKLFDVWLRDASRESPRHTAQSAARGVKRTVEAYKHAIEAVEREL